MDANERITNRLERLYSLFGAGDVFDTLVSVGGHAYRADIRRGVYRTINTYLKDDPRPVADSEADLVVDEGQTPRHPIPPESLRVFPTDADLPKDELNTTIDQHFVPRANVALPEPGAFPAWKETLLKELRRVTFRAFEPIEGEGGGQPLVAMDSAYRLTGGPEPGKQVLRAVLVVRDREDPGTLAHLELGDATAYVVDTRGVSETRWTRKNPPNFVERSCALLGFTVDTGRVWDAIAAARRISGEKNVSVAVAGHGGAGVIAAYAALLDERIASVAIADPPLTHMDAEAPALLNVLRVCDIPEALGMLAPRPLTIAGGPPALVERVRSIYRAAGAETSLTIKQ